MEISLVQKDKERVILRVKDVSPAYMNAIRRIMSTETPVLAIEDVEIRKNSGALYDEMIAHRLGMLSIKTDHKSYNLPNECACKGAGCAQCQVKLTLSAVGPKTVYAEELKSKDPKAVPVHGKTIITKLLEGQELELEATAQMGLGVEHSKLNAGLVYYKEYPHLKVGKVENAKELAGKYPEIVEEKGGKLSVIEKNIPLYDLHEALIADSNDAISVEYKKDYILTIESWGQLSAKDMFEQSLVRFDKELEDFKAILKEA